MYQALYRKWRPQTFDDVAGQEHITTTLKNELKLDRISHAYLFTGSRGTGKTSCAKILAKAVNCLHPHDGNPCGECEICRGIDSGSILDVVEMDAASNRKIDNIRDIIAEVQYKPTECRYRVYIIDEVHMLIAESFNALLKILEEPPEHAVFILATTEVHKIMLTIQSRCQRFDFHRIPPRAIADRLLYVSSQENITLADSSAMLIASVSDGALRDALSLLDRCISISKNVDDEVVRTAAGLANKDYLYDLAACVINKNTAKTLEIIDRLYGEAKDMPKLCDELIAHFRGLMLIKSVKNPRNIVVFTDDEFEQSQTQADYLSLADIVYYMDVLSRAYQRMGTGTGDRTELEMALVKLSSPELDVTNEAMAARITALEKAVKKGSVVTGAQNAAPTVTAQPKVQSKQKSVEKTEPAAEAVEKEQTPEPLEQQLEPIKEEPKAEKKQTAPAVKQNVPRNNEGKVDIVALSKAAKPFPQWVEIVESLKSVSRTIAASFAGSTAYENGSYLLIDTQNQMVFDLMKQGERRKEIRRILLENTGKSYHLGPYKPIDEKQDVKDPLQVLTDKLKDAGVDITEE